MTVFCGIHAPFGCCRLTQHKRFVPYGTHPNSAFGGISFMLRTLDEIGVYGHERKKKNKMETAFMNL